MQDKEEPARRSAPLSNISYNYLVESCVDEQKARVVLDMMNESLGFPAEETEDQSRRQYDARLIESIMLNKQLSFYTRLTEAHARCPEIMKKTIVEHYNDIVKDNKMRKEVSKK